MRKCGAYYFSSGSVLVEVMLVWDCVILVHGCGDRLPDQLADTVNNTSLQ